MMVRRPDRTRAIGLVALAGFLANPAAARPIPADLSPSGTFTAHINGPLKPIMGWNPWNAYRTQIDEGKIMAVAHKLVDSGLTAKGYRYINIDDGWWLRRGKDGRIVIRTTMFPSAALPDGSTSFRPFVDRLHAMGLKAGIYSDIGRNACAQRWDPDSPNLPSGSVAEREIGSMDYQRQDVRLFFREWGFDLVKLDACGLADYDGTEDAVRTGQYRKFDPLIVRDDPIRTNAQAVENLYASFAQALRAERSVSDVVLSICVWGEASVRQWGKDYGTMWRTAGDLHANWRSMLTSFDSAAPWTLYAGPGHWNDPDMMGVGLGDFDKDHLVAARTHVSMWAILSAPLILGYRVAESSPELIDLVGNPEVIGIDQDPAGNAGSIVSIDGDAEVIAKSLTGTGSRAVAFVNRGNRTVTASVDLTQLGLTASGAEVRDLWAHRALPRARNRISFTLAPREARLVRVNGTPINRGGQFLGEIPGRINIAADGTASLAVPLPKGWVPARIGFTPAGAPLRSAGQPYSANIGILGNSRIEVRTDGAFRRLRLNPAVTSAPANRTVAFRVYGDGKLLAERKQGRDGPMTINVAGVRTVELVADAGGKNADAKPTIVAWRDAVLD